MVPMLIEADLTRRAAVIGGGAGVLGDSVGPSLSGMLISPGSTSGTLWLGAGCLALCLILVLRWVVKPSGGVACDEERKRA